MVEAVVIIVLSAVPAATVAVWRAVCGRSFEADLRAAANRQHPERRDA